MDTEAQLNETVAEAPLGRLMREQGRMKLWLADEIGTTPNRVTRLCAGTSRMHAAEAVQIAKLLGVTVEELVPSAKDGE